MLIVVATPWQYVGLWRSARRHMAATGRRGWASLACASGVTAALARSWEAVFVVVPVLVTFAPVALGRDPWAMRDLRVIGRGRELVVTGPIGFGLTAAVEAALAEHPTIRVLRLNSEGGRVAEARRLNRVVVAHRLTTYTERGCFSACTLVFVVGRERVIDRGASLGFHQYAPSGLWPWQLRKMYAADEASMIAAGVDPAFARQAYMAPHPTLWKPLPDQLLAAKFVTRVSGGAEFAIDTMDAAAWTMNFDEGFRRARLGGLLARYEPDGYRAYLAEVERIAAEGGGAAETYPAMRDLIRASVTRHLTTASDDALVRLARFLIAATEYRAHGRRDTMCETFMLPDRSSNPDSLTPELTDEEKAVHADIIESAETNPMPAASPAAARALLQPAAQRLEAVYGSSVAPRVANLDLRDVAAKHSCVVLGTFYRELVALGPHDTATVMRALAAP